MKISQAMRRGARKGPQLFGRIGDENGGTCAYGAICIGGDVAIYNLENYQLLNMACNCPIENCSKNQWSKKYSVPPELIGLFGPNVGADVKTVIVHLNDVHRWARERIAGWIEAQLETPTYSMLDMQRYMVETEQEAQQEPATSKEQIMSDICASYSLWTNNSKNYYKYFEQGGLDPCPKTLSPKR